MGGISQLIQNELRQYPSKGKEIAVTDVPASNQLALFNALAQNNSGATASVGVMRRLALGSTKLYDLQSAVYTQLDLSQLSGGLQVFTTTIGDGYVVAHRRPVNLLGVTISVVGAGGVFDVQYWNGSAFVTALVIEAPADYSVAADTYTVLTTPIDWVAGGPAGLDQTLYNLQVVATTAPGGAVSISDLWNGNFLTYWTQVLDGQGASIGFDWNKPLVLESGENVMPYYNSPDAANNSSVYYAVK